MSDYKVTLDFGSRMIPSKNPVAIIGGKPVYHLHRKTDANIEVRSKDGTVIMKTWGSVTCNNADRDIPALGQKQAISAAIKNEGGRDVYKEIKVAIWDAFRAHSKAAAKIMEK